MHAFVTSKNVKWCHLIWPTLYTLSSDYEYYSHYGPEAYYAYYAMHPYYKGYYEEMGIPQTQEQGYGEG